MFCPSSLLELGEGLVDALFQKKSGVLLAWEKVRLPLRLLGRQSTVSPAGGDR